MLKKLKKTELGIAENRSEVINGLIKIAMSDLMVFWGTERELVKRQEKLWLPIIKWLEDSVLRYKLSQTKDLNVPKQQGSLMGAFTSYLEKMSNKKLAAFYDASMTLQSMMIAAAFVEKKITPEQAFDAAYIEEIWQNETWGTTDEALERQNSIKSELKALRDYLDESV
ncbi:MAG: hypothetical protein LBR70_01360 [Lactobacillaceae bacterium]|nr:hypothetical protein [Lactobacillaceae bacterium]